MTWLWEGQKGIGCWEVWGEQLKYEIVIPRNREQIFLGVVKGTGLMGNVGNSWKVWDHEFEVKSQPTCLKSYSNILCLRCRPRQSKHCGFSSTHPDPFRMWHSLSHWPEHCLWEAHIWVPTMGTALDWREMFPQVTAGQGKEQRPS